MTEKLQKLIEIARHNKMSPEERQEQIISFVYGNTSLENSLITRESVRKIVKQHVKQVI